MPIILAWISRHPPTDRQRAELTRLFGPHELRTDTSPFADAAEIKRRIYHQGAQEFVCIAPITVLKKLLEYGLQPLTAKMQQCDPAQAEVETRGRYYKFLKFQRLKSIDLNYQEIIPYDGGQSNAT